MSQPDPTQSFSPLDPLIAEYLQAVEAGQVPDRQKMLDRHPELADALRAFFADFDHLDRIGAPLRVPVDPAATSGGGAVRAGPLPTICYFGDYELLEEVARGGMGVVYKARQVSLNRLVALKMVLAGTFASPSDVQRFRTEAESAANLEHPHIVPIYEIGEHDGQQYYTMRYVEGTSLAGLPRGHVRAEVTKLVEVARAVHHAHRHGVLHRDLKPSNVLVDLQGTPFVTDFGLAKRLSEIDRSLTPTGQLVGTPRYMAPEQSSGRKDLTVAADIYSLGVILYERLTGQTPFTGEDVLTLLRQVRESEPPRPSSIVPGLDRDLETIVLKCLEKEPGRRYATAGALADDLDNFLADRPITARRARASERTWRWCRRNPAVATLSAVLCSLLIVVTVASMVLAAQFRGQAMRERALALAARAESGRANQAAEEAREQSERSGRLRYAAEINAAAGDYQLGNIKVARSRLDGLAPARRGFEWHYLHSLLHQELRVLRGHRDLITCLAFSPDGRRVASSSLDGTVRLWDTVAGRELTVLINQKDAFFWTVAYSPDGRQIAAAAADGVVRLLDAETWKSRGTLKGPGTDWGIASLSVAFTHDGQRIALAGRSEIQLWDLATGREYATLNAGGPSISCISFSPDDDRIGALETQRFNAETQRLNETLMLWDLRSQHRLPDIDESSIVTITQPSWRAGPISASLSFAFSPDGRRVVTASSDKTIRVRDTKTGKEQLVLVGHESTATSAAFSPDGKRVASASLDGTVRIWDADNGRELLRLRGHESDVMAVAYSPDGRRIASAGRDGSVRIWDAEIGLDPTPEATGIDGLSLKFSGRDDRLAIFGAEAHILNLVTGRHAARHKATGRIDDSALSPDGKQVASGCDDGMVRVWSTETGRDTMVLKGHTGAVRVVATSPDGERIASGGQDRTVRLWNAHSGQELFALTGHETAITSVEFSLDGKQLATSSDDGTVRVWSTSTGQAHAVLKGHKASVAGSWFSPDGTRLAVIRTEDLPDGSRESSLYFWDARSEKDSLVVRNVAARGHQCASFRPDGLQIAVGLLDGTIALVDVGTGRVSGTLQGHNSFITGVIYFPDGERILSAESDGTVKIWDAMTGRELMTLIDRMHNSGLAPHACLAMSPNGRMIASQTMNAVRRLWDGTPSSPEMDARREALGVVRFHHKKASSEAEFLERIRRDMTISDEVRAQAVILANAFWKNEDQSE